MPLTYSTRTRKGKGIKTFSSFFPRSMWEKVGEREEKRSRRKRNLLPLLPTNKGYKY